MFFDEVKLELEGGRGGNGFVSFHTEKYVDHGYPDGGDGGNGGNLILLADENFNTLQHFAGRKHYKAGPGENGYKNEMAGHGGEDLILHVPVGTLVYDEETGDLIHDFAKKNQKLLIAKGGRGGYGNAHFPSSIRQAPDFAELGDSGEYRKVRLEMRLVADIGLVGFPSAGKSTLISHVSDAKPKVAAYPFTTLIPNLGVVNLHKFKGSPDQTFVIADMPGIIEGASEGKGLGNVFLKHISRTATLVYVLDPFAYDGKTIEEQYEILHRELKSHDKELVAKGALVLMNKIDAIPDEDREKLKKDFLKKFPKLKSKFRMISAASGENLKELVFELWNTVQEHKEKLPEPKDDEILEYIPKALVDENSFEVKKMYEVSLDKFDKDILSMLIDPELLPKRTLFEVKGKRIQQISRMTNPDVPDAINRVYDVMIKNKIYNALKRAGARNGDIIKIDPHFFEFHEER